MLILIFKLVVFRYKFGSFKSYIFRDFICMYSQISVWEADCTLKEYN